MNEASKRKRVSDPQGQPDAKRLAPEQPSPQDCRAAIASVYAAYDALHRANNNGGIHNGEDYFAVILNAATQGNIAVQRLAARLLPKFAPRFPAMISDAAGALQGLGTLSLNEGGDATAQNSQVHMDSLEGLRRMLLELQSVTTHHTAVISGVAEGALRFALRQQQEVQDTKTSASNASDRSYILSGIAKAAFVASPDPMLALTLQLAAGDGSDGEEHLRPSALKFLEHHLLDAAKDEDFYGFENTLEGKDAMDVVDDEKKKGGSGSSGSRKGAEMFLLVRGFKKAGAAVSAAEKNRRAAFAASSLLEFLGGAGMPAEASPALFQAIKAAVEALTPREPSPMPQSRKYGLSSRKEGRRRGSDSASPRAPGNGHAVPALPPSSSKRARRGEERDSSRGTSRGRSPSMMEGAGGRGSRWSPVGQPQPATAGAAGAGKRGRAGTPGQLLEEGELDEGEIPQSNAAFGFKVQKNQTIAASAGGDQRFPQPGSAITLAAACLYFSRLPKGITEKDLGAECSRFGRVEGVFFVPPSSRDPSADRGADRDRDGETGGSAAAAAAAAAVVGAEAYVNFRSTRDASMCFENVAGQTLFRGNTEPVRVRFCPSEVMPAQERQPAGGADGTAAAAPRAPPPPPTHVWISGATSSNDEYLIRQCIRLAGNVPEPQRVTLVKGRRPGALLAFGTAGAAEAAEAVIRKGWPPRSGPSSSRGGGGGGGRERERDYSERDSVGRRRRNSSPIPPPRNQAPNRGMPPLEYACKSLWVGQVPLGSAAERDLISAFAQFGELTGHRIIARSSCAFFNFVTVEGAIEARRRLDGAYVAGSNLVVEFKNEKQYWSQQGGSRGGGGGFDRERGRDRERERDRRPDGGGHQQQSPFAPPGGSRHLPMDISPRGGLRRSRSRSPPPSSARLYSTTSEALPPQGESQARHQPSGTLQDSLPFSFGDGNGERRDRSASQRVLWQGHLAKQRQPQAEIACVKVSGWRHLGAGWAAEEPAGWPTALEVSHRVPTAFISSTVLLPANRINLAVLKLVPAPGKPEEGARLGGFSSYLAGKQRAGVVDLGSGPQPGAPVHRIMYLVPPNEDVCRAVGERPPGDGLGSGSEFMLAIVTEKRVEEGG